MKPRLLVIINRFVIGGQAADTIPLLFLLKDHYTIKLIYGEKEAGEIEPLFLLEKFPGLDLVKLPSLKRSINPFRDIISFWKIYSCIRKFKPHIVHTHGAKSGLLGRLAAKLYGKAVIVHTFHGHLFHSYFSPFVTRMIITVERLMANITDAAIALSPAQKCELVSAFKIYPENKMHVIPLGLFPPQKKHENCRDIRKEYDIRKTDVVIAIVGRIVPIKNHVDFLRIGKLLLDRGVENVKFLIVGDGIVKAELFSWLKAAGIPYLTKPDADATCPFIFTSWVDDIFEIIGQVDIVVLTSSNEGTPVSLIEAQLCGKPVVAYNVGGVKDTLLEKITGFLVNKGDISTFADRLIQLVLDEGLRKRMGEEGVKYSSQKFSKKAEVERMNELYLSFQSKR